MKRMLICITALLSSLLLFGQDSLNTEWVLSVDLAIQAHDKRLYDFPPKKQLLASQPETFGTYQIGISVSRHLFGENKIKLYGGLGLSSELSTFVRPFDHRYGEDLGNEQLLFTDRYYQFLLQSPIKLNYMISKHLGVSMEILPQLDILTIANEATSRNKSYSWSRFDFYSIQLNSGIEYSTSLFDVGLKYRVFQLKKIDRIIFNYIINDPRTDQIFETYNPFKIWLSIGYDF